MPAPEDQEQADGAVQRTSPLSAALSGAASGALVASVLQPFDVLRTRMQADALLGQRAGLAATCQTILREHGLRGFWRGTSPTVARLAVGLAVQMAALHQLQAALTQWQAGTGRGRGKAGRSSSSAAGNAAVAAAARTAAAVVTCPLTALKTQMENTGLGVRGAASSPGGGLVRALRRQPPGALLRGLGPTVLSSVPFSAAYYPLYSALQGHLHETGLPRPAANFLAGCAAACAATLLTQPCDVVRTHMQLGPGGPAAPGVWATTAALLRTRLGPAALFAGAGPRMIKRPLQTALVWTLHEELQPRLQRAFAH